MRPRRSSGVDRGEPLLGVDRLDPVPDVEAVVVALERLVRVERLGADPTPTGPRSRVLARDGRVVVAAWLGGHGGHSSDEDGRSLARHGPATRGPGQGARARRRSRVRLLVQGGVSRRGDTSRWRRACGRRDVEPRGGCARTWVRKSAGARTADQPMDGFVSRCGRLCDVASQVRGVRRTSAAVGRPGCRPGRRAARARGRTVRRRTAPRRAIRTLGSVA